MVEVAGQNLYASTFMLETNELSFI